MWLTGYYADAYWGIDYFSKLGADPAPGTGTSRLPLIGVN